MNHKQVIKLYRFLTHLEKKISKTFKGKIPEEDLTAIFKVVRQEFEEFLKPENNY